MSDASDLPELLTRAEAAAYLGVKAQTLSVWATAKRYDLPFIKVGSLVRYRRFVRWQGLKPSKSSTCFMVICVRSLSKSTPGMICSVSVAGEIET